MRGQVVGEQEHEAAVAGQEVGKPAFLPVTAGWQHGRTVLLFTLEAPLARQAGALVPADADALVGAKVGNCRPGIR
jgi:hypothetical protein